MLATLWRSFARSHTARLLLWCLLFVAGTTVFACTYGPTDVGVVRIRSGDGEPPAGVNAIRVAIHVPAPSMTVQARQARAQGDVHHYKIRLYNWTGTTLSGVVGTPHNTNSGTVSGMYFTNVIAGQYKITAEAWGDAGETQLFNESGFAAESSNAVTVGLGGVTGGPLTVTIQLHNGIGDRIDTTLNVGNGRTASASGLAPDDGASASAIHGYTTTLAGVNSDFVWIPTFTAYQLFNPGNCGSTDRYGTIDSVRPIGFWVSTAPAAGTPGTDWVGTTLGGFYVAKYEASRSDANSGSPGSSTLATVRANVVPWTNVTWDDAAQACTNVHPAAHLMRDDEWTALAVWSQINNLIVKGNNNNGQDITGSPTFSDDTTHAGTLRALTGGSASPTLTAHDGSGNGVQDLNGNVAEWTASVEGRSGMFNWFVDGLDSGRNISSNTNNKVVGQATVAVLQLFSVPVQGTNANADFGNDGAIVPGGPSNTKCVRGGSWADGDVAGLWYVNLTNARTASADNIGFRPVLRF